MKVTYDFQIVSNQVPDVCLIYAQNEEAYDYLVDEANLTVLDNGSAPIYTNRVGDFISDSSHAHLCCEYIWLWINMTYIVKTTTIRGDVDYIPFSSLYNALETFKSEKRFKDTEIFLLDKQAGLVPIVP